ncbi:hypothetical protein [Litorilituus lipolyticus]|uniref:Uncharacterized protein n=1 Tax=Litorilituus lipolyticus TaxID=2491017 RepID=A0A502L931_9GAMM|nr:hypothetical protein [Litorilituus lipolyticus]TPH18613.1 hypothetical protein EPA86_02375 [Litorilituus lipolyticus]
MSDSGFSSQKLNLTLALCAILISAASFYATYLQANAAEKQVKAMTLPLLQYGTGNVEEDTNEPVINFRLVNGGVGPAIVKTVTYKYHGKSSTDFFDYLKDCCSNELKQYNNNPPASLDLAKGGYVTSSTYNVVIPAQDKIEFYKLYRGELSEGLWSKLNIERRHLKVQVCYCSLLDECYLTENKGIVESVDACPVD